MLVTGGKVFYDGAFHEGVSVRVWDNKIVDVGQLSPIDGETITKADGMYVLPGFVDIHIHGFMHQDCMEGEAAVRHMSRNLKRHGVAAFAPTTMSASVADTRAALSGIACVMDHPEADGAHVLGAHMEAPFLCAAARGAQDDQFFLSPSPEAYEELTRGYEPYISLMTLAPEIDGARALIAHLKKKGVVTCCAHTAATAEQVHDAADAGLTQITHLFNAQTPLKHREPGVPGAALADPRIAVQVIADCIHLHPDILRIAALCKADAQQMLLITDAMMAGGMPDGEYSLGGQRVIVSDGAARLENGALAGSTLTLAVAIKNMITRANIAPEKVIPMATSAPAASVGLRGFGKIKKGYDGTLAIMDANWDLNRVI